MATRAPCVKLLLLLPKSSTICGENCIFLFSLNQHRPKLHSKFCGRNLETRESPNLRKYPIRSTWKLPFQKEDSSFLLSFMVILPWKEQFQIDLWANFPRTQFELDSTLAQENYLFFMACRFLSQNTWSFGLIILRCRLTAFPIRLNYFIHLNT